MSGWPGSGVDDEVAVRRQRVQAGPGTGTARPAIAGRWASRNAVTRAQRLVVALERPRRRRHRPPADVLADLRARVAVGREAVERRLVHPDPDREPVLVEQPRVAARREPADLLLGHGERQVRAQRLEQVVRPGVGREHDLARGDRARRPRARRSISPSPPSIRATGACSRRTRALRRREPPVGDVAARRVREAGVGLEQPDVLVAQPPGGPAAHDLGAVEASRTGRPRRSSPARTRRCRSRRPSR